MQVLLLRSLGRKSDQVRENLLYYLPHTDGYLIAASNAGARKAPGWYFNLRKSPDAVVMVNGETHRVRSIELEGKDYEEAWARLLRSSGGYTRYAGKAERHIPVLLLNPKETR